MAAPSTIQIFSPTPGALDGSTPFVPDESLSFFDPSDGIMKYISVTPFGVVDLAALLKIYSQPLVLNAISVENSVSPHARGSVIEQISPNRISGAPGNRRIMQDMWNTTGVFPQANHILPLDQKVAINTMADGPFPGPHTVQISLAPFSGVFLNNQLSNNGGKAATVLSWKEPVRVASTANFSLSVLFPGTSIDGVSVEEGDRVLLKDQTAAAENGIYIIQGVGEPAARSEDASNNAEVSPGLACAVVEGTTNKERIYVLATPDPIQLGTTALTFVFFGSGGGGGGETYAETLTFGQDSGALGPYLNGPQRSVIGSTVAASPTPGVFTSAGESYRYDGSHFAALTSGGGEAGGTYLKDPTDLVLNSNTGLFSGIAVIEWTAVRVSSDGANPPTNRGYATGKEIWSVGSSTASLGFVYPTVAEQFSGFDTARLAVGSTARSVALEVLDGPAAATPMTVKVFYRVTYFNNSVGF